MKKRFVSMLLVLSMCMGLAVPGFAAEEVNFGSGDAYVVDADLFPNAILTNVKTASNTFEEALCELEYKSQDQLSTCLEAADINLEEKISPFLSNYSSDLSVSNLDGMKMIDYYETNGLRTILTIDEKNILIEKMSYDSEMEVIYTYNYITEEFSEKDAPPTQICAMTDEEVEKIEAFLKINNIDSIRAMPGISVDVENGNVYISKVPNASAKNDFSYRERQLKEQYPIKNGKPVYSGNQFCTYLKKNVPVVMRVNMNNYIFTCTAYKSFSVGDTLSLVASVISTSVATIQGVLGAIGAGYSGGALLTDVDLSYSYRCTYNAKYFGTVLDTTGSGSKYVTAYTLVPEVKGKEIIGNWNGTTKNKEWDWVFASNAPDYVFDGFTPSQTTISLTIANYSDNLYQNNGYCSLPTWTP